jgi:DNA-binding winged helix-turn-helix (wHTH) protein
VAAEEKSEFPFYRSIRFDLFELDAKNGQLRRSGVPIDLSPQLLRVLVMLAERPGELVTRKEMKEALWQGQSYGDFDSRLNFVVKKLREALGDDAEQPRYIQTVRGSGYRFIASMREPQPGSSVLRDPVEHSRPNQGGSLPAQAEQNFVVRKGFHVGVNPPFLVLTAVFIMAVAATAVSTLRQRLGERPQWASSQAGPGPEIASVTPILPQARQGIVIQGRGFGLHVPYARTDSPYLAIRDQTAHWAAGRMIPQNSDEVMLDVESWTDTEIVLSGFSGAYGQNWWKLSPGDSLEVAVWNPQSGVGPGLYHLRASTNAP